MNESNPQFSSSAASPGDRRRFGRQVALGLLATGLAAGAATAQEPIEPARANPPVDPPATNLAPPLDAAAHLLEALTQLYPLPAEPERREAILADLRGVLARSRALAAYPFANADEPAPIFAAWRSDGESP